MSAPLFCIVGHSMRNHFHFRIYRLGWVVYSVNSVGGYVYIRLYKLWVYLCTYIYIYFPYWTRPCSMLDIHRHSPISVELHFAVCHLWSEFLIFCFQIGTENLIKLSPRKTVRWGLTWLNMGKPEWPCHRMRIRFVRWWCDIWNPTAAYRTISNKLWLLMALGPYAIRHVQNKSIKMKHHHNKALVGF